MTAITSATSDSIAATMSPRGLVLAHEAQHPLARLRERGERLERLEGRRQTATVALVVMRGCCMARLAARPCFEGCLPLRSCRSASVDGAVAWTIDH